jgi:hypothetical protein
MILNFPKDQEINIEIRKLKSKGIPSSKYIGILLKHFGSKSNSFEKLNNKINSLL